MAMNKLIIGLTGGIASGKTTAAKEFSRLGFFVIDADEISRNLTDTDAKIISKIALEFPNAVFKGVICRRELARIVFDNSIELEKLNSIMHPKITYELKKQLSKANSDKVLLVAPLLFETGINSLTKFNITISADEQVRIQRLIKRNNITYEDALKRIKCQLSDSERNKLADYVIYNEQGFDELVIKVREIASLLKDKFLKIH